MHGKFTNQGRRGHAVRGQQGDMHATHGRSTGLRTLHAVAKVWAKGRSLDGVRHQDGAVIQTNKKGSHGDNESMLVRFGSK